MPKVKTFFVIFLSLFLLYTQTAALAVTQRKPAIQHATIYKYVDDISQYWISEKLDGMRGYWNGKQLLTRQGNIIHNPKWFTQNWPTNVMDGELWVGRAQFQATLSCVRKVNIDESCWRKVRFMIFDLPEHAGTFSERIAAMKEITGKTTSDYLSMIKQFKLNNTVQLNNKLTDIVAKQGEGLMLHHERAFYYAGRTTNIMKLKKYQDAEATVVAYVAGKGKYQGMLGALKVKTTTGVVFKIGSGFTDIERVNPPAIGSLITYKYNGKTQAGIPRFARFYRIKSGE